MPIRRTATEKKADDARDRAKAVGKPVFLAFGAVWRPVCRHMEEQTILEAPVQALAEALIWVKIDIDRNQTLAERWGAEATPTIYLLDPGGSVRQKIVGGAPADEW